MLQFYPGNYAQNAYEMLEFKFKRKLPVLPFLSVL